MRSGMYHIDVRLSSELVEDNVGLSMSSRSVQTSTAQGSVWGTMSGAERCRQSLQGEGRL